MQEARDYAESIIATVREPLVVLNGQLRIISASRSFYDTSSRWSRARPRAGSFMKSAAASGKSPACANFWKTSAQERTSFEDFRVEYDSPTVGHKVLLLNGRRIAKEGRQPGLILLAMEEIAESSAASGQPREQP